MEMLILLARVVLAAVFLVAGLAKLADRAGSRQALLDFGVPARLATPGGMLLPLAELLVAALLLPVTTAWWGALGALALLLAFVAGIGYNLARGRQPDCHCFGQLHSAPAGWLTLARNAVLALLAGLVMAQGPSNPQSSTVAWLGALSGVELVLLLGGAVLLSLLAAEGWLLLNLLRQNGRRLLRVEALEAGLGAAHGGQPAPSAAAASAQGLPVGTPAPAFQLGGLHGETGTLDSLRAATKPVMLVFSDPGCGPCNALLPDLARWLHAHAPQLTIALVSRGTPEANRAKVTEHGLTNVLLQQDREVAEAYQVHATPTAVLVQPEGTIGNSLAPGVDAIKALVARTVSAPTPVLAPHANGHVPAPTQPATLPVGASAQALTLPNLDGTPVALSSFQGRATLLLFWNPGCGFWQRVKDDLKVWEANPPTGVPQLVRISTGAAEADRVMGLRSPILLDQSFIAGRQFGATGTPSAVLLNEHGAIASHLAVGADAIRALLGSAASTPRQQKEIMILRS